MTIQGLASLEKKLTKTIPAKVTANAREAMETSADEIVAMMKRLAPVLKEPKDGRRPGALRDSIDWTWGKVPAGATSFGTVKSSTTSMRITIFCGGKHGDDVVFWHWWEEYGTAAAKAQPFFSVSWRALGKRAKSRVSRAIGKAVREGAT